MRGKLVQIITASDPAIRNQSLDAFCREASLNELLAECEALEKFRQQSENLYERVRALFFLYATHRFHLPEKLNGDSRFTNHVSRIPFHGYEHLLQRRFEEAIEIFLAEQNQHGASDAISSALASAYYRLGIQTLADQVRRSVRSVRGNQWMFRMGHPADQPLRIRPKLLQQDSDGAFPILRERTPVRMDLTHSAWSDIFFLGMDFPEGAKVLNVSIDLGVHGRDAAPKPPVEAYLRVIEEPLLRLTSVDLGATVDITNLNEVFDFAKDYLGLLKAAVIASGIVPPGIEGSGQNLSDLLARIVGAGRGLELVSNVNNIPKGSRLAVSTNLLAALISVCMRATRQAQSLEGQLEENERRLVLARAILGEWLGGSGGGWQDSGGVWPGIKLIEGVLAKEGDPEFGISRGRLMPQHKVVRQASSLSPGLPARDSQLHGQDARTGRLESCPTVSSELRRKLQESLVLVHGGMAQNVGPILEMVTEKYLLRSEAEWKGRQETLGILNEIFASFRGEDVQALGKATTRNFQGPLQTIIPWASNFYTENLINQVRAEFGKEFWGFWMLGGMSGGGMGFIFSPTKKADAQKRLQEIMSQTKRDLEHALPFAMEPVVYDFAINENGTFADLLSGDDALLPQSYYALLAPKLLRVEQQNLPKSRRVELEKFANACRAKPEFGGTMQSLFDRLLPRLEKKEAKEQTLTELLEQNGFDRAQHEQIRADLKDGRIGLAQNRLPQSTTIEDVKSEDVLQFDSAAQRSGAGFQPATGASSPRSYTEEMPETADRMSAPLKNLPAPQPTPFVPFEKERPAAIHRRRLPHWEQSGATYFVTFRLADALPARILRQWQQQREQWLRKNPEPLSREKRDEFNDLFREKMEGELDRNYGSCVLQQPALANIVEQALRFFDGDRYQLGSFVIMPNHVHVLVRPMMNHSLSDILHSWKSFTANQANALLKRTGTFWQDESFDHIVRDEQQLQRFERYIVENPQKARLEQNAYRLGFGSGHSAAEKANPNEHEEVGQNSGAGFQPADGASSPREINGLEAREADRMSAPLTVTSLGERAIANGEIAVVTLAAGSGTRWTQGAGVVKALHPFCKLGGRHRTFLETHLAKSRRSAKEFGAPIPHIFTTSYLTHSAIHEFLARRKNYNYAGPLMLSAGKSIGLRMIPTERDLRFAWEEMPQQLLDEQAQKVRESLHTALIGWAKNSGEASDYTDNLPSQCLHPVGHWYEVPNLLRNGTLQKLLETNPNLKYLLLHNIDTLGANVDPALLGLHIQSGACLSFEVITRRLEDRGGGLARVNGRVRLVEGLAMPREEAEFDLSYYNSMTTWIDLDKLLEVFKLTRADLDDEQKISNAIRVLASRLPTYITLKDVKKRWGHGQEDIFPVAQFEKLWSDMTALPEVDCRFIVVPRMRGQQLKDQAQLDGWLRDGSAAFVESLCEWE
jgi:REP element-mobilizing transposase RayT